MYVSTKNHTWYHLIAHVLRKNGSISRARIGKMIFFPHMIMLRCTMEGQKKQKDEHPLNIAFLHNMWLNIDIVSEDDLPLEVDAVVDVPEECCQTLPTLMLENTFFETLNEDQRRAFQFLSDKINLILSLHETNQEEEEEEEEK